MLYFGVYSRLNIIIPISVLLVRTYVYMYNLTEARFKLFWATMSGLTNID